MSFPAHGGPARAPITAGQDVRWDQTGDHTSGSENGLTAIAVEGVRLTLFAADIRG